MPRAKVVKLAKKPAASASRSPSSEPKLAPGISAGTLQRVIEGVCRVELVSGGAVSARIGPGVSPALVEECLRERRTVLVTQGRDGPVMLGTVQTAPSIEKSAEHVRVEGREVELVASDKLSLRVGRSALELDEDGVLRLAGKRLTIDVAALVRVLSAKVELP